MLFYVELGYKKVGSYRAKYGPDVYTYTYMYVHCSINKSYSQEPRTSGEYSPVRSQVRAASMYPGREHNYTASDCRW